MQLPVNKIHIKGGYLNLAIMVCLAVVVGVSVANVAYFAKIMDNPSSEVSRDIAIIMVGMNGVILIASFLILSYHVYRMVQSYEHKFGKIKEVANEYGLTEDNVHRAIDKKPRHKVTKYKKSDPVLQGSINF